MLPLIPDVFVIVLMLIVAFIGWSRDQRAMWHAYGERLRTPEDQRPL